MNTFDAHKPMYDQVGRLPQGYLDVYAMLRLAGIPQQAAEALARRTYMAALTDEERGHG